MNVKGQAGWQVGSTKYPTGEVTTKRRWTPCRFIEMSSTVIGTTNYVRDEVGNLILIRVLRRSYRRIRSVFLSERVRDRVIFILIMLACGSMFFVPAIVEFALHYTRQEAPTIHLVIMFIASGAFITVMAFLFSGILILATYHMLKDRRIDWGLIPNLLLAAVLAFVFIYLGTSIFLTFF